MSSQGKRGKPQQAPRAVRAARTPGPGQQGGPFAGEAPERLIVSAPQRGKPRADEADANFQKVHTPDGVRLQKVLAGAGVASRRVSEALIGEGRVMVDGLTVVEPGVRVDPDAVAIHVDGVRVSLDIEHQYVMFNKPAKVMTTMSDPQGRRCIEDFLTDQQRRDRLVHVGRLDYETEGLLLLTNDGDLTNRLTHPSYEVSKTYMAQVEGKVTNKTIAALKAGIQLEDGPIAADSARLLQASPNRSMVEVSLHSGRNRIVRRMFDAVGHPVTRLVRTGIGQITIGDQPQGTVRTLGAQEIGHLKDLSAAADTGALGKAAKKPDDDGDSARAKGSGNPRGKKS